MIIYKYDKNTLTYSEHVHYDWIEGDYDSDTTSAICLSLPSSFPNYSFCAVNATDYGYDQIPFVILDKSIMEYIQPDFDPPPKTVVHALLDPEGNTIRPFFAALVDYPAPPAVHTSNSFGNVTW